MSRTGLVGKSGRRDDHDAVDDLNLLRASASLTQSTSELSVEIIFEAIIVLVQVDVGPKSCRVVAMDNDCNVSDLVTERTGIGGACDTAYMFQRLCKCVFPKFAGVACCFQVSYRSFAQ